MVEFSINHFPSFMEKAFTDFLQQVPFPDIIDSSPFSKAYSCGTSMNVAITPVLLESELLGFIVLGPYLPEESSAPELLERSIDEGHSHSVKQLMRQFINSLSILRSYQIEQLSYCLGSMAGHLETTPEEVLLFVENESALKDSVLPGPGHDNDDVPQIDLDRMEKLHQDESFFLQAVEHGNFNRAIGYINSNKDQSLFSKRLPNDPIRRYKNLGIVLNTLLRKAVERGGVFPLYIDSLSEKYSILIEKMTGFSQVEEINRNMIFEYCQLVNHFAVANFSPLIKKVIEYIRLNLNRPLSLTILSEFVHSSPSNISRRFKKETGECITDYINLLRIKEAQSLLIQKNLSVTEIALSVGFNDSSYFSKIFKKIVGKSPHEYRSGYICKTDLMQDFPK